MTVLAWHPSWITKPSENGQIELRRDTGERVRAAAKCRHGLLYFLLSRRGSGEYSSVAEHRPEKPKVSGSIPDIPAGADPAVNHERILVLARGRPRPSVIHHQRPESEDRPWAGPTPRKPRPARHAVVAVSRLACLAKPGSHANPARGQGRSRSSCRGCFERKMDVTCAQEYAARFIVRRA